MKPQQGVWSKGTTVGDMADLEGDGGGNCRNYLEMGISTACDRRRDAFFLPKDLMPGLHGWLC